MLKNGIILILRKFKAHALSGLIFTTGLSIGYTWFVSAMYKNDWFGLIGALVIIIATASRSQPMTNKKELGLYKIFGAHNNNILPFIIIQAVLLSAIATTLAIALMGIVPDNAFINIKMVLATGAEWLLPLGSLILILVLAAVFYRIFIQARASISKN